MKEPFFEKLLYKFKGLTPYMNECLSGCLKKALKKSCINSFRLRPRRLLIVQQPAF